MAYACQALLRKVQDIVFVFVPYTYGSVYYVVRRVCVRLYAGRRQVVRHVLFEVERAQHCHGQNVMGPLPVLGRV